MKRAKILLVCGCVALFTISAAIADDNKEPKNKEEILKLLSVIRGIDQTKLKGEEMEKKAVEIDETWRKLIEIGKPAAAIIREELEKETKDSYFLLSASCVLAQIEEKKSADMLAKVLAKANPNENNPQFFTLLMTVLDADKKLAVPGLINLLKVKEFKMTIPMHSLKLNKQMAFFTLFGICGNECVKPLTGALKDNNAVVRENAVFVLRFFIDDGSVPALVEIAKNDKDPVIRKSAVSTLGDFAGKDAKKAILEIIKKDDNEEVKIEAIVKLFSIYNLQIKIEDDIGAALKELKNNTPNVQSYIDVALAVLGGEKEVEVVVKKLEALEKEKNEDAIKILCTAIIELEDEKLFKATSEILDRIGNDDKMGKMKGIGEIANRYFKRKQKVLSAFDLKNCKGKKVTLKEAKALIQNMTKASRINHEDFDTIILSGDVSLNADLLELRASVLRRISDECFPEALNITFVITLFKLQNINKK